MDVDATARADLAVRAARAGAAVAAGRFRRGIAAETKSSKTDVVTEADREAQRAVVAVVREASPGAVVVGEEEGELDAVPASGSAWIIDPIDGTNNFVRGLRVWCTSVAAVVDGKPVAGASVAPALGDVYRVGPAGPTLNGEPVATSDETDPEALTVAPTFWWDHDSREAYARACRAVVSRFGDMRRFGCAQLALGAVATGGLDGVLTDRTPDPWDTVAGAHLVEQAGGRVTDLAGEDWRHDSEGLVASNGAAHGEVLAAAREIRDG